VESARVGGWPRRATLTAVDQGRAKNKWAGVAEHRRCHLQEVRRIVS